MDALATWLATPLVLRCILLGVFVEAGILVWWHRRRGRGPRPALTLTFLGAGAAFLVALLALRAPTAPGWAFLLALTSALVLHVWHLALLSQR
jgi:uncharacterized iron-regulated membrane protein